MIKLRTLLTGWSKFTALIVTTLLLPALALAQIPPPTNTLQRLLYNIPPFINNVVIPFLFGLAFLAFIINVIRFFVLGSDNETGKENAKNLAFYSVIAFVFLVIFWGVVNLLTASIGLNAKTNVQPCPDYQKVQGACPR